MRDDFGRGYILGVASGMLLASLLTDGGKIGIALWCIGSGCTIYYWWLRKHRKEN